MNGDKDKQKTIGQMLFTAGAVVAIPFLTWSAKYGALEADVKHLQKHETNFPHPPENYKRLVNKSDEYLQRQIDDLSDEIDKIHRELNEHERTRHAGR